MIEFKIEDIELEGDSEGIAILKLPELTEAEKNIINPIVAPTSGLRIQIYDIIKEDQYLLTRRNLYLFLRVFRAISDKFKDITNNKKLKILIVTDDRPSRKILLKYCSAIFAHEGFEIYHQQDDNNESRLSSPYGAASVALLEDIDLIIVLTASHNDLSWNGIKFYIQYAIPMSGDMFKDISQKALTYDQIRFNMDFKPILINAEQKNNDYVRNILANIIEIKSLKGRNIIIWPYLGKARGIVNLFKEYEANVILIEEEINPPNPIKIVKEEKIQKVMSEQNSDIAVLLDADRDRIALYIKQDEGYFTYIPNEIYSAMHNILANEYDKKIINVRTIPSDLRGDKTSFINILTGVGYKHLGIILYFLLGVEIDQSKIDTAILYVEDDNGNLIKINNDILLKHQIIKLMEKKGIENEKFIIVMWEESGGHTINIVNISKEKDLEKYTFNSEISIIADKYPVPALILITELICRGHIISKSIDWAIVGINSTIPANDEDKIRLMKNFEEKDNKIITIKDKKYHISALSDNNKMIDIYQLKSDDSTLYFRPSGTGPEVRFYIFGKRETHLNEIKTVQEYINNNFL
ncbi:MAG: hypothetical protein ACFFBP_05445 [Promethearchaeota archaeon]